MLDTLQILHSEREQLNRDLKRHKEFIIKLSNENFDLRAKVQAAVTSFSEEKELLYKARIAQLERGASEMKNRSVVSGVGPDVEITINEKGGKQSVTPARLDLLPPLATLKVGAVLQEGAEKYGEDNWRDIDTVDHVNHVLVHIFAYLAGDDSDDHLSHAATRAMFALELDLVDRRADSEEDDYKGGGNAC